MKRLTILLTIVSVFVSILSAQRMNVDSSLDQSGKNIRSFEEFRRKQQQSLKSFRTTQEQEYQAYREQINKEYIDFMRKRWKVFEVDSVMAVPEMPKPITPPKRDPNAPLTADPIIYDEQIVQPIVPVTPPRPIVPTPIVPTVSRFEFEFYGTRCVVSLSENHRFTLRDVDENIIADTWTKLTDECYDCVISECLQLRDELNLCDWGYYCLLEDMATSFFDSNHLNEARLLQTYLLVQSGYKIRMACCDDKLVILLPSQDVIYGRYYLAIEDEKYYVMMNQKGSVEFNVFQGEFPKEQAFSLVSKRRPQLTIAKTSNITLTTNPTKSTSISFTLNQNLIDFYNEFPKTQWNLYAQRSLSEQAKQALYPALRNQIVGKTSIESANYLLAFVQHAFEYQTDEEQFGYERPLFADETLYYPYCDCEDRSILYAILIKDLLDLNVVLLHYPGHLATAVCFDEAVQGDYLVLENKKYFVCDPTYIGASIGQAMAEFKNIKAKVILWDF